MIRFVLASASPRRRELLGQVGINFEISPAYGEEIITEGKPQDIVERLASEKACEVAGYFAQQAEGTNRNDTFVIIGADTLVYCAGEIMGKPRDTQEAMQMLMKLQGNTHQVYTGVSFVIMEQGKKRMEVFHEKTDVHMYPITEDHIRAYIATGEPMDKAGAYAIQGRFAMHIKGIEGDYNNVIGLPVAHLMQELFRLGLA